MKYNILNTKIMKTLNYLMVAFAASTIIFSCDKPSNNDGNVQVEEPKADFEFAVTDGTGDVNFINKSENATSYEWEFGDEKNGYSAEENPMYTYEKTGSYQVSLTAINGDKVNTVTKTVSVNIPVVKQTINIKIDNNYDDWNEIPWRDDVKCEGELLRIKTACTDKNIYVMLEGNADLMVKKDHITLEIDIDNDVNTGSGETVWVKENGCDIKREDAGAYVYGWRAEEEFVGWDWTEDGALVSWESKADGDKCYMEWKIDMTYGTAIVMSNEIFSKKPEGVDFSRFATKISTDTFRMHILFRYTGDWTFSACAPERGGVPFEIKVGEYLEAR